MKFKHQIEINYLFYGVVFLFISLTTVTNILSLENIQSDFRSFFILHCIGQALLESFLLILIGHIIEFYFPKIFFPIFLGISFLFLLTHVVDFILIRIMDLSFWNALNIVIDETFANFIELLTLTGLPLYVWIVLFFLTTFIPFIGIILYKFSNTLSKRYPLSIKNDRLIQGCFCLILGLFMWDKSASFTIRSDIYQAYQKALPWKTTFLSIENKTITLPDNLKTPKVDKSVLGENLLLKKPNIYIFIIESLREDFITEKISPSIYNFKKENISFDLSLANSNNTHCSWYSIFYSQYPLYWVEFKKNLWEKGSIPLNILKKEGYKIHLLTSSGLHYYKMDDLLFGKNRTLLDSSYINDRRKLIQPYKSDEIAINKVIENDESQGNVFLIFLESTHFNYSWPPDFQIKFKPISENISYITYTTKQEINAIKNRYRNSLNYLDSLFEKFVSNLKKKNLYDDSIIVITGDHGEEFFEKGHLFHASHLSHVQTNTPIYYKLGKNERKIPKENLTLTSQVDIFSTILDYISLGKIDHLFDGESIFRKNKFPWVISTRYNGSRSPNEFFIHDGTNKIVLKFKNRNIFNSKELQIISIRDLKDEIKFLDEKKEQLLLEQTKNGLIRAFYK